jgi:hypothetical protein
VDLRRQEQLDSELAAQSTYVAGRKAATAALTQARNAYRKTGGED